MPCPLCLFIAVFFRYNFITGQKRWLSQVYLPKEVLVAHNIAHTNSKFCLLFFTGFQNPSLWSFRLQRSICFLLFQLSSLVPVSSGVRLFYQCFGGSISQNEEYLNNRVARNNNGNNNNNNNNNNNQFI